MTTTRSPSMRSAAGACLIAVVLTSPPCVSAGAPVASSSFYTVTPCRLLDTRSPVGEYGGPALASGAVRSYVVAGRCGVPLGAEAVSVSLTVVSPTSNGHLRFYATGSPRPDTASINYSAGQTRSNNAIVALGGSGSLGTLDVYVAQGSGTVHLVVDVVGYFRAPGCTPETTPASPLIGFDGGTRTITWAAVPGATSYDLYYKVVDAQLCATVPMTVFVTRSDVRVPNVSSPFDVSGLNRCGVCYVFDGVTASGECESPLHSDLGQPAPLGFSLMPCVP